MARRAFFSFHYKPDASRAGQVRNIGVVEGNTPVSDNDWETVTKKGDAAIKKWIAEQMYGRSCTVVLAGSNTAGRKWINHEIVKSWDDGMGVVGIHIHGLKNLDGKVATKGSKDSDRYKVFNLVGVTVCNSIPRETHRGPARVRPSVPWSP